MVKIFQIFIVLFVKVKLTDGGVTLRSLRSKDACRPRCLTSNAQSLVTLQLTAQDITPEAFAPFGQVSLGYVQPLACECCLVFTMLFAEAQVIGATDDGKSFDNTDAALNLDLGTPRCA